MDRALEHGINFFDTANRYGGDKGPGATESIVGRWFAQGGGRREKVVLATKVFGADGGVAQRRRPLRAATSATPARRACAACRPTTSTSTRCTTSTATAPWDEVWQAMENLVDAGKVIYVGSSNFAGWHIAQANEAAKHRNFLGLVSEQSLYNLASRTVELEVLPACRSYGVGVIPWSPLAGGMLGGMLKQDGDRAAARTCNPRYEAIRPQIEAVGGVLRRARRAARRRRARVAARAERRSPRRSSARARSSSSKARRCARPRSTLDESALKELDTIFPGPADARPRRTPGSPSDRRVVSNVEGCAFAGGHDGEALVVPGRALAEERVEHVVVVRGVVMERHEVLDVREPGERERVTQGAVPPPDALSYSASVYCASWMQHVDPGRDVESRAPLGRVGEAAARQHRFVIGQVRQAPVRRPRGGSRPSARDGTRARCGP